MQLHPGDVAQHFEDQAAHHADHETPCFVVDSQPELGDYAHTEEDCQRDIAAEVDAVGEG